MILFQTESVGTLLSFCLSSYSLMLSHFNFFSLLQITNSNNVYTYLRPFIRPFIWLPGISDSCCKLQMIACIHQKRSSRGIQQILSWFGHCASFCWKWFPCVMGRNLYKMVFGILKFSDLLVWIKDQSSVTNTFKINACSKKWQNSVKNFLFGCPLWKILATHWLETNIFQKQPLEVSCNFNTKRLWHRYFPVNFAKFLLTPFLQNTNGWLVPIFLRLALVRILYDKVLKRNAAEQANTLWD